MSHKLERDEQVSLAHVEKLQPSSYQFAELVVGSGASRFDWSDIVNVNFVCKSWSQFVSGPFRLNTDCRKKFYSVFNGQDDAEKVVAFHERRKDEDNNVSIRCLLLVLESQMLLVCDLLHLVHNNELA
jgi:hypothetical protein